MTKQKTIKTSIKRQKTKIKNQRTRTITKIQKTKIKLYFLEERGKKKKSIEDTVLLPPTCVVL